MCVMASVFEWRDKALVLGIGGLRISGLRTGDKD